jgi:hypothetical protein
MNIFLVKFDSRKKSFFRCSATAVLSLVSPFFIIEPHKCVQIVLNAFKGGVEPLPKSNRIELVLDRLIEFFGNPIGLRMSRFSSRVLDVVEVQVKLVGMVFRPTTVLSATICQCPQDSQPMLIKGNCLIIRRLASNIAMPQTSNAS